MAKFSTLYVTISTENNQKDKETVAIKTVNKIVSASEKDMKWLAREAQELSNI